MSCRRREGEGFVVGIGAAGEEAICAHVMLALRDVPVRIQCVLLPRIRGTNLYCIQLPALHISHRHCTNPARRSCSPGKSRAECPR